MSKLQSLRDALDCKWDVEWSFFRDRLVAYRAAGVRNLRQMTSLVAQAKGLVQRYEKTPLIVDMFVGVFDRGGKRITSCPAYLRSINEVCFLGWWAAAWTCGHDPYADFPSWMVHPVHDFVEDSSWPISSLHSYVARVSGVTDIDSIPTFIDHGWSQTSPSVGRSVIDRIAGVDEAIVSEFFTPPAVQPPVSHGGRSVRVLVFGLHKIATADAVTTLHLAGQHGGFHMKFRDAMLGPIPMYPKHIDRCSLYAQSGADCPEGTAHIRHLLLLIHYKLIHRTSFVLMEIRKLAISLNHIVEHTSDGDADLVLITSQAMLFFILMLGTRGLSSKPRIIFTSDHLFDMVMGMCEELNEMEAAFREAMLNPTRVFAVPSRVIQVLWHGYLGVAPVHVPFMHLYLPKIIQREPSRRLLLVADDDVEEFAISCLVREFVNELAPGLSVSTFYGLTWEKAASHWAAAYFPYATNTMKFFELYNMAVPIYVPRSTSQYAFVKRNLHDIRELRDGYIRRYWSKRKSEAYNVSDVWSYKILVSTEIFQWSHVSRFSSLADLISHLTPSEDCDKKLLERRRAMRQRNIRVQRASLEFWTQSLAQILQHQRL